jgi:DNA processing protein
MTTGQPSPAPPRSVATLLVNDDRLARATWSRLAEPTDAVALELIGRLGAGAALDVVLTGGIEKHERFRARVAALDPRPALDVLERLGGRLVCPADQEWPSGLDSLADPPICLWVRGPLEVGAAVDRSVSLVGSRAATAYGQDVTHELADGCAERGFTVVSGGAFGIDGSAHAAALRAGRPTIAVLAGGVDRAYLRARRPPGPGSSTATG